MDQLTTGLDLLTKTEHDMDTGIMNSVDTGIQLSSKIHAGIEEIGNITIDTPAGKQLARDLLARVDTAEKDVIKNIGLVEDIHNTDLKVS